MFKKFFAVFFTITVLVMTNTIDVKADQKAEVDEVTIREMTEEEARQIDVITGRRKTLVHTLNHRNNNIPTNWWNISSWGAYYFDFYNMMNYTYTDYYFTAGSNGKLFIRFDQFITGGDRIRIQARRLVDNNPDFTYIGDPENTYGITISGLIPYNMYYIKFEAYEATDVDGSGWIYYT